MDWLSDAYVLSMCEKGHKWVPIKVSNNDASHFTGTTQKVGK